MTGVLFMSWASRDYVSASEGGGLSGYSGYCGWAVCGWRSSEARVERGCHLLFGLPGAMCSTPTADSETQVDGSCGRTPKRHQDRKLFYPAVRNAPTTCG